MLHLLGEIGLAARTRRVIASRGMVALIALGAAWLAYGAPASAQSRRWAVDARVGSGLSVGGGDGHARLRRTPIYVEAGAHTWLAEEAGIVLGGALRVEVEDHASIGAVARAGLRTELGPLELRPSIGLAVILAPRTLVGVELGSIIAMHFDPHFALLAQIAIDGWLFGDDLPQSTVLTMLNGALGVEFAI